MQVGKLHWKNHSTVWQMNFALFAQQLLFLGFGWLLFREERKRKGARERERVGKRHRQRVRLNYEKRLCILSRALPQTFASIMHTPTQSACGTQLHWRYQREREREIERERESCAPAARTAPFCQTSQNSLPHGKFDEFPAVFKHFGWFAWLGSLATLIAS